MPRKTPGNCTQCGNPSGLQAWCSPCKKPGTATWREQNPGYWRPRYLRQKYGITLEEYAALFDAQSGKCRICGDTYAYRGVENQLIVDHDHSSGQIRGLLCEPCNLLLGLAKDDPERLRKAAAYLEGVSPGCPAYQTLSAS